ncbi:hypothetical protein NJB1907Z4_P0360 (plasmid) [Mycobacterium pseudoshottsii]|uniref:Uncharacterized protein n=1 Tax=Mycobacterium pseudoshottsii TaxID=265949 RepID=A0A9N7QQK2_9MYCO|nr:hypothetical protein NJB1907Z4_P0360 [Mycobacterium pseudoshottsii]
MSSQVHCAHPANAKRPFDAVAGEHLARFKHPIALPLCIQQMLNIILARASLPALTSELEATPAHVGELVQARRPNGG